MCQVRPVRSGRGWNRGWVSPGSEAHQRLSWEPPCTLPSIARLASPHPTSTPPHLHPTPRTPHPPPGTRPPCCSAEEHLPNTLRQMLIYEALGYPTPQFGHMSLILAPDKSKLSKRCAGRGAAGRGAQGRGRSPCVCGGSGVGVAVAVGRGPGVHSLPSGCGFALCPWPWALLPPGIPGRQAGSGTPPLSPLGLRPAAPAAAGPCSLPRRSSATSPAPAPMVAPRPACRPSVHARSPRAFPPPSPPPLATGSGMAPRALATSARKATSPPPWSTS